MTTTLMEPWQLDADDMPDDEFPDGLRLSTDCVCRRLIEPLEADRYHEFPEHLSKRGHGFEWILQRWLRRNKGVDGWREIVVPWEFGETHLDLLLPDPGDLYGSGGRPVQIEVKANKDAQVRSENVRQVQRQMFATERALAAGKPIRVRMLVDGEWVWVDVEPHLYADTDWRVVVIDPTTWRIPNPAGVRVTISEARRVELESEWEVMAEVMSRRPGKLRWDIEWEGKMPPCTCGKCWRPTIEAVTEEMTTQARLHIEAREEKSTAEAEVEHRRDVLRELVLLRQGKPNVDAEGKPTRPDKAVYAGGGVKVTVTKTGSILTTESGAKPTPLL